MHAAGESGRRGVWFRVAVWLVAQLGRSLSRLGERRRQALARGLGGLAFFLRIRRGVALDNLAHAFPDTSVAERRRICREAYAHMALTALEGVATLKDDPGVRLSVDNLEALRTALEAGRGAVVVTAHFGGWERVLGMAQRLQIPFSTVVRPLKGVFNAALLEARARAGIEQLAPRNLLQTAREALSRGRVVVQVIDQSVLAARGPVYVPFFGRLASTTPAPAVLALRTGAPLFMLLLRRTPEGFHLVLEGPLGVPTAGDPKQDILALTALLSARLEAQIRACPEQWLWMHRRWKVQPRPEDSRARARTWPLADGASRQDG